MKKIRVSREHEKGWDHRPRRETIVKGLEWSFRKKKIKKKKNGRNAVGVYVRDAPARNSDESRMVKRLMGIPRVRNDS